jgi:hypothetical protein
MEVDPNLKSWPEAVFAILLAGPEQSVDGGFLNLSDAVDDKDGVGSVNAALSVQIAKNKRNGAQPSIPWGFDYGTFVSGLVPTGGTYQEVWNALVPPGGRLRVAVTLFAQVSCPDPTSCGAQQFPRFTLRACGGVNNATCSSPLAVSNNVNSNYQYLTWVNPPPPGNFNAANVALSIRIDDWSGLASTSFGVAWYGG